MSRATRTVGPAFVAVAFVVLGLPDFAHGVAWPAMRSELDRSLADLGLFVLGAGAAYLVVAVNAGRLAARWGIEGLVLRATLASAAGLAVIAVGPTWAAVLIGSTMSGLGAGGMDTGFNASVALTRDGRLMGLLHAGYGLGAAVGPLLVGASLAADLGWRPPYGVFAVASLLLALPVATASMGDAPPQQRLGSPRGMVLPCLAFLLYVSLEVTLGQWAFTFLTAERGLGELVASSFVSAYWVALTAGRLWLGLSGHRVRDDRLLSAAITGALAGTALVLLGGPVAPAGLVLAGLGLSLVFPLLMLATPARVGAERAAAAVGWQTAASSVGAVAGPAAAGVVLDRVGIGAYGTVGLVMAVALAAVVASAGFAS